jgi:phage/plasmid-like protein (TIGR03299 family)
MSHEIDTMAYVGEQPWHELGTYVGDQNITSEEMIVKAKMDWNAEKRKIFFKDDNGKDVEVPDNFAIVRTDKQKALGVVGNVFTTLQNKEAFKFFDKIVGQGRACYHTAGSLMGGKKIWVLVDLKMEDEIVKGDEVKLYGLLSNGHDGKSMVNLGLTHTRVVCWNTLQEALNTKEQGMFFRIRHTAKMEDRIDDANLALQAVSARFKKFVEHGKILAAKNITRKQLEDFLIRLELERANEREEISKEKIDDLKKTEKYKTLVRDFEMAPGNKMAGVRGTLWAAVNAVTYYVDHQATGRLTSNFKDAKEARFNSAMFNGGADKKTRAMSLALEMAKN